MCDLCICELWSGFILVFHSFRVCISYDIPNRMYVTTTRTNNHNLICGQIHNIDFFKGCFFQEKSKMKINQHSSNNSHSNQELNENVICAFSSHILLLCYFIFTNQHYKVDYAYSFKYSFTYMENYGKFHLFSPLNRKQYSIDIFILSFH